MSLESLLAKQAQEAGQRHKSCADFAETWATSLEHKAERQRARASIDENHAASIRNDGSKHRVMANASFDLAMKWKMKARQFGKEGMG